MVCTGKQGQIGILGKLYHKKMKVCKSYSFSFCLLKRNIFEEFQHSVKMFQSMSSEGKSDYNSSDATSNPAKHKGEGKSVTNQYQNVQTVLVLQSS